MYQNPLIIQHLSDIKTAEARRDAAGRRTGTMRADVGQRLARPLIRLVHH